MKRGRLLGLGACTLGALLSGSYLVGRARGAGVPGTQSLTYSGVLTDAAGAPLSGTKNILVALWDQEAGGAQKCSLTSKAVVLSGGAFQIALDPTCTTAIHGTADLWIEVSVDGASIGRSKLGAVPYALEAETASKAGGSLDTRIASVETSAADLAAQLKQAQADITLLKAHPTIVVEGKKYSVGTFVKATAAMNGAAVGGYAGAKQKCEAAVGSPSAHECSPEEMVRSSALALSTLSSLPPAGWVASGTFVYDSANSNHYVDDCMGYTKADSNMRGATWAPGSNTRGSDFHPCDNVLPILCCD